MALSHILAVLLLRGGCPSVPRRLVLPGPARLDISLLPDWNLALGPCFLVRSPTIRRHPMGCPGWRFVYVSTI